MQPIQSKASNKRTENFLSVRPLRPISLVYDSFHARLKGSFTQTASHDLDGVQVEWGVARLSGASVQLGLSNLLEWLLKLDDLLLLLLESLGGAIWCVVAWRGHLAAAGRAGRWDLLLLLLDWLWVEEGTLAGGLSG